MDKFQKIQPEDNLIAALQDLVASQSIDIRGEEIQLIENIQQKHIFSILFLKKTELLGQDDFIHCKREKSL
jgi:hypothetical protein